MDHTAEVPPALESVARDLQHGVLASVDVHEFLTRLARNAAQTMSREGVDVHCGVTLKRHRRAVTVAADGPAALSMDETRYGAGDGPCLTAVSDQVVVNVPDVDAERRWRPYFDAVRSSGIRSILAVPFDLEGQGRGSINLYAGEPDAFPAPAVALVRRYAEEAGTSLMLAVRISRLSETNDDLTRAMRSRTTIDLALGVLMDQNRCSQNDAATILRKASANRNVKMYDLAKDILRSITDECVETQFDH